MEGILEERVTREKSQIFRKREHRSARARFLVLRFCFQRADTCLRIGLQLKKSVAGLAETLAEHVLGLPDRRA